MVKNSVTSKFEIALFFVRDICGWNGPIFQAKLDFIDCKPQFFT